MSGPWDRPPSRQPDDEWPSEDLREPRDPWVRDEQPRDPDPSQSSGWDDWGSPAPPDSYLIEEPDLPTTDLWSESWAEEAAASGEWSEPQREPEPRAQPEPAWSEPAWSEPAASEPPPSEPDRWGAEAPASTWTVPEPEPPARAEPEPAEPEAPRTEPHPEPWAYDVDPWVPEPVATSTWEPSVASAPEPTAAADAFQPAPTYQPDAAPYPEPTFLDGSREPELPVAEPASEPSSDVAALEMETAPAAQVEPAGRSDEDAGAAPDAGPVPSLEPEPPPAAAPRRRSWWASGPASWLGEPAPDDEQEPIAASAEGVAGEHIAEPEAPAAEPPTETQAPAAETAAQPPAEPEPATDLPTGPEPDVQPEPTAVAPGADAVEAEPDLQPEPIAAASGLETIEADTAEAELAALEAPPVGALSRSEVDADAASIEARATATAVDPGLTAEAEASAEPEQVAEAAEAAPPGEEAPPVASPDREAPEPIWTPEPWPPAIAPPAPGTPVEPAARDFTSAAAALGLDTGPDSVGAPESSGGDEPAWPEEMEGTQVFPSTWRQPTPAPRPRSTELEPHGGRIRTSLTAAAADVDADEAPTTAEQAVPWLIGVILLLAGMVIVLLALIFAGDASLGGEVPSPSLSDAALPSATTDAVAHATPSPRPTASAAPSASVAATPTPLAIPEYGPLEMVYLGRSAALAHIYLLRHDFTVAGEPEVLAQDPALDVRSVAWSPDGVYGAGLYADLLISIEPGAAKRSLADGISAVTFGADPATLYAVRVTQDGANDVATVLAVDYASGAVTDVASVSYARPSIGGEDALSEAQFIDDGGPIRLFWMEGGSLRLWILGGGVWEVDPADGTATPSDGDLPTLWSARGSQQIVVATDGTSTTLTLQDSDGEAEAQTALEGLVSHLRWSPGSDRVVFTLGRSAAGGGVLQDLFLWDLGDGEAPTQLTATGAAFSAEWLGTTPKWRE